MQFTEGRMCKQFFFFHDNYVLNVYDSDVVFSLNWFLSVNNFRKHPQADISSDNEQQGYKINPRNDEDLSRD